MDVMFDEVTAEISPDSNAGGPAPSQPSAAGAEATAPAAREHEDEWRSARAERVRDRLAVF